MYAITHSGLKTHYKIQGNTDLPALIFIPGTLGDKHSFDLIIDQLKETYCCVSIDIIGRGDSIPEQPSDGEQYTIENQVRAVDSVVNDLSISSAYLAGHSLGAVISISYAHRHPGKVKGLVLLSALLDSAEQHYQNWNKAWSSTIDNIDLMSRIAIGLVFSKKFLSAYPNTLQTTEARLSGMSEDERKAFTHNLYSIRNHDILQEFTQLTTPTLCIHGVEDIIHPVNDVEAHVNHTSYASLRKINHAAHALNVECPSEIAQEVLQFVK